MVKSLKIDTVAARRGLRSIERRRHSKPIKFISVALPLSVYVLFGQKNRQSTIGGFFIESYSKPNYESALALLGIKSSLSR